MKSLNSRKCNADVRFLGLCAKAGRQQLFSEVPNLPCPPSRKTCPPREYLRDEVERLLCRQIGGRYQTRDSLLILLLWRHGLQVSEAIDLRWSNIDWNTAHLYVKRRKTDAIPASQSTGGNCGCCAPSSANQTVSSGFS